MAVEVTRGLEGHTGAGEGAGTALGLGQSPGALYDSGNRVKSRSCRYTRSQGLKIGNSFKNTT